MTEKSKKKKRGSVDKEKLHQLKKHFNRFHFFRLPFSSQSIREPFKNVLADFSVKGGGSLLKWNSGKEPKKRHLAIFNPWGAVVSQKNKIT